MSEIATRNVMVPYSGEVVSLDAPVLNLAALLDEVKDVESRLRELKGEVSEEIHRRMDKDRKWTISAGEFKLTGKSDASVVEYDPEQLATTLTWLVDGGEITTDAMDEALEVVTTYKVKKRGVEALRKSPRFRELIDACGEERAPEGRRVSVGRS